MLEEILTLNFLTTTIFLIGIVATLSCIEYKTRKKIYEMLKEKYPKDWEKLEKPNVKIFNLKESKAYDSIILGKINITNDKEYTKLTRKNRISYMLTALILIIIVLNIFRIIFIS